MSMGGIFGSIPWGQITTNARELFGLDQDEGRTDNENFQWAEGQANEHNTNEIGRQSEFLKGMVPAQSESYNAYQDATYGQDTQRQIDRIKATGDQLGMSPWELNGGGAATPLPAGEFMKGQAKNTQNADPYGMLQTQIQSKTAKDIARINQSTALQTTAMQTGNQRYLAEGTPQAKASVENTKMQTALAEAQQGLARANEMKSGAERNQIINNMVLENVRTIMQMMPRTTFTAKGDAQLTNKGSMSGYFGATGSGGISGEISYSAISNWNKLMGELNDRKTFGDTWRNLDHDEMSGIVDMAAKMIDNAKTGIDDAANAAGEFLKGQKGKDMMQ